MDEFLAFYKETLLEKVRERSDTHCSGCILGEQDRRDHPCQADIVENIDRYFHTVFAIFMQNKRQVMERLKSAFMQELLKDCNVSPDTAKKMAEEKTSFMDMAGPRREEVTSSTPAMGAEGEGEGEEEEEGY